ncbi:MAG: DUF1836 domain-containing protein [Lachnospiraceae bacterium]|nr:DUF1836 domain-containing protein [Lachnospiraceae bacterium]
MGTSRDDLKKYVRDIINLGYIVPEDIPSIELYMDQVTTFMDKHLSKNKRNEDDKTLTKTMINNYTKNELLPPSNKKRYSKEHIILLIYIYYLKNVVSINDIHTMLTPLIENFYNNPKSPYTLEDIYTQMYELEKRQYFNTEHSIIKTMGTLDRAFQDSQDEYLKKMSFLSLLGYDIFMKKKLMEHIIDEMAKELDCTKEEKKEPKKEAKTSSKAAPKKPLKKETPRPTNQNKR